MEEKLAFLKEEWFMWLMLVIFSPVGIYLMFKYNKKLKEDTKYLLLSGSLLLFIIIWLPILGIIQNNKSTAEQKQTAEQVAEQIAAENKQAVQDVEKKIKAIGDPKAITLENLETVNEAKQAYNSLLSEQKGMVRYANLRILVLADENVTILKNKDEDEKAAADKIIADQKAAEKAAADKIIADQEAAEKAAAEEAAAEQVAAEQAAAEQVAAEQAAAQQAVAQDESQSITVYTTNTGSKYHVDGCEYLSKSKIPISLEDAKKSGLTPCKKCHPPQ